MDVVHVDLSWCAVSSPCGRMPSIFLCCLQHTINSLHLLDASLSPQIAVNLCLFYIIRGGGGSESKLHMLRSQLNSASMLPHHCSAGFFLLRNRTRQDRNVQILVCGMKSQGGIKKWPAWKWTNVSTGLQEHYIPKWKCSYDLLTHMPVKLGEVCYSAQLLWSFTACCFPLNNGRCWVSFEYGKHLKWNQTSHLV